MSSAERPAPSAVRPTPAVRVTAVVGNPKAGSRTRLVAEAVSGSIARRLGARGCEVSEEVVELAELGPDLLSWSSPQGGAVVERVRTTDVLVVATPVYKATFPALLKLLLDRIQAGELADVVAVPVMVGAGFQHALAVDVHLRPVLLELGACCPTQGLFVVDSTLDDLDAQLDRWGDTALRYVERCVLPLDPPPSPASASTSE